MAPKAGKEPKGGAVDHLAAEQKRLFNQAYDEGMLCRTRRVSTTSLPPTKQMLRADGKDIVKKSSTRKNRYLLVFNCQLAPAAAGKLGTLAQLDSPNPVMYIEFPEGRLKLLGTLAFPKNKYMVLKLGAKEALCEDVMDSMIVFSEARWVGTQEENPQELELPMPASLGQGMRHEKYEFSVRDRVAGGKEGPQEVEEAVDEDDEPPSQRPQRAAARTARGKRQRYNEDSDAEEDDIEGSEGGGKRMAAGEKQQGAAGRADGDFVDLVGSGSNEGAGGHAARGAEDELSPPPSSSRPRRAAAGAAAKRLRIESSDSEEESEGDSSAGAVTVRKSASSAAARPSAAARKAGGRAAGRADPSEEEESGGSGRDASEEEEEGASDSGPESDYVPSE